MPTSSSSGRESSSRHSSRSAGGEVFKSSERREKSRSTQTYDGRRRGSKQGDRPQLKSRTYSAPLAERRRRLDSDDGLQTGASTPRVRGGGDDGRIQTPEVVADINIAILGAGGVGKSTFIQQALELHEPLTSQTTERRISVKGTDYLVRLLELGIDDVEIDEDSRVGWPETIDDNVVPRIDGALTLYDIKEQQSLEGVPEMLGAMSKSGIPSVLVSCKCDALPENRQLDPTEIEQKVKKSIKSLDSLQVSANIPDTHRRGLSMILRTILSQGSENPMRSLSATRRRAHSNALRSVSPRAAGDRGHTRAASVFTGSAHTSNNKEQRHSRHDSSVANHGSTDRLKIPHEAPPSQQPDMHGSFLFEESTSEAASESGSSSADAVQMPSPSTAQSSSASSENGTSFDELVDRLLAQPTSKADNKFAAIFLALYRKFAAPGRLLEAIVERFDALDQNGYAHLTKTVSQMRYVAIMEQWVGTYPGDFAFHTTKRRMRTFVAKLGKEQIFSVAAKEINADLDAVREDDDTNWANCDRFRDLSRSSISSSASTLLDDPTYQFSDEFSLGGSTLLDDPSPTLTPRDDAGRSMSTSTVSSQQVMVNVEAAQKQSELLQPSGRQSLSKIQWRALMDYPDEMIARELTRMDFIMFSSIRPRDLIRNITLKEGEKALCKNLSHVKRFVDHFNQLACWVSNYILLRDKPKHRAWMMEKFMRIGRKLREMNNYNALGAVIAGIKSTAVHRLAATRELIPPAIGKDWMKLEILMAPSRSHFAYRLAWENSSSERIPYLPLHLRDLSSAEEGNRTFLGGGDDGGRINWKKFEIMGDVIVSIQKAQGMPYRSLGGGGGRGNQQIKELVLDVELVKDEDDLFERSKLIEPTGSGTSSSVGGGPSMKFKDFFKR